KACLSGDLIVPDGMSVVWASRLARVPFPERVAGVDLMARLLREAASRGLSAYFLGARREVVSKLAARCAQTYPGLSIAGWRDGYFRADDHAGIRSGMAAAWAARLARVPFPEGVAGVDLMARLLREAASRGLSAYFLGARREVVSKLAARCAQTYPGLSIAGWRDGYFRADDHAGIVEQIRERAPHMLFVGMPSPFKETWCERHRDRLSVPVIMGVGGSFDVLSGYVQRAPRWVQSIGMEWAWRLGMEPRKMWKRYLLTNSEFLWLLGREIIARRLRRP